MKLMRPLTVIVALSGLLASCQPATTAPPPPLSNAAKTVAVAPLGKTDVVAPGEGTTPTTKEGLASLLNSVMGAQSGQGSQVSTLMGDVAAVVQNPTAPAAGSFSRALSDTLQTSITQFNTALQNFPTTKSATFSTDLSKEDFGTYLDVTKAKASLTVTATTFDGLALASSPSGFPANGKSASVSALGSFEAALTTLPDGSIKGVKLRANLGADASASLSKPLAEITTQAPGTVSASLDYKISASVAVSVNTGTEGGIIVVTANGAYSKAKSYPLPSATAPDFVGDFAPASIVTVSLDVYDNAGALAFHKDYQDVNALIADFAPAPATPAPATPAP